MKRSEFGVGCGGGGIVALFCFCFVLGGARWQPQVVDDELTLESEFN